MSKTSKLIWHDQDVQRLLDVTFGDSSPLTELERSMSKVQETDILNKFDMVVEEISKREQINKTLFFSKKAQKDFVRLASLKGLDFACKEITPWRSQLIKEDLSKLLK